MNIETIEKFINEKIAPGVAAHGGEVQVINLEKSVLTISLSGACGSCGVQSFTSEAISNYIMEEFPELENVILEQKD